MVELVVVPREQLHSRRFQAALDLLGTVRPTTNETRSQGLLRGRSDEHEYRVAHTRANLASALDFDLEHERLRVAFQLRTQRAVAVAGVLRPLQKFVFVDLFLELIRAQEVVVDAMLFTRAGRPGGRRDRELHPRKAIEEKADHRPLADPR